MQLVHNPITKILNEKLKSFDFNNLEYLMCQKERVNQFQYKLKDLVVDLTRQPLNQEIKNELIKLARVSNRILFQCCRSLRWPNFEFVSRF